MNEPIKIAVIGTSREFRNFVNHFCKAKIEKINLINRTMLTKGMLFIHAYKEDDIRGMELDQYFIATDYPGYYQNVINLAEIRVLYSNK